MGQTEKIAAIQIAPVFLNSKKTWNKLSEYIREAHDNECQHVNHGQEIDVKKRRCIKLPLVTDFRRSCHSCM